MPLNIYALTIGSLVAIYVIIVFQKTRLEKKRWVYPLFIASFPAYYWFFALYISDYQALVHELWFGILFIIIAYLAYLIKSQLSWVLLGILSISHAAYDVLHDELFINNGTPTWWPEFCAAIDILLGMYLLFAAVQMKNPQDKNNV